MGWQFGNTVGRYGLISILFHWSNAVMFILMLFSGFTMTGYLTGSKIWTWYAYHKMVGVSLLLLATGRLMHRLLGQVVRSPSWRIHYGLYTGIIAMPLSGWILSSSAGYPPKIFGIALPIVSAGRQWLTSSAWYAHFIIAFLMIITIATHIADLLLSYRQGKRLIMRMWLQ